MVRSVLLMADGGHTRGRLLGVLAACLMLLGGGSAACAQEIDLYATFAQDATSTWNRIPEMYGAPPCVNCTCPPLGMAVTPERGTTHWLIVSEFQPFTLPAGFRIVDVRVNVLCRYEPNFAPQAGATLAVSIPGTQYSGAGTAQLAVSWSGAQENSICKWRFSSTESSLNGRFPFGFISDLNADPNLVNQIDVWVRKRNPETDSNFFVDAVRLLVELAPCFSDCDGDGRCDPNDPDDDNDGVLDGLDCASCDGSRWRTQAYADVDGDGLGAGNLVTVGCFGATPPAGFSLASGDECPDDPLKTEPGGCGCGVPDSWNMPGHTACDCVPPIDNDDFPFGVDLCPCVTTIFNVDLDENGIGDACEGTRTAGTFSPVFSSIQIVAHASGSAFAPDGTLVASIDRIVPDKTEGYEYSAMSITAATMSDGSHLNVRLEAVRRAGFTEVTVESTGAFLSHSGHLEINLAFQMDFSTWFPQRIPDWFPALNWSITPITGSFASPCVVNSGRYRVEAIVPVSISAANPNGSTFLLFEAFHPADTLNCPADRDGNCEANVFDLLAFLDDWFNGTADLDASGATDVFDLLAYLDAWFIGC